MANTHNYELVIGTTTFGGSIEINNAGVVSYQETSVNKMSKRIQGALLVILDELAKLPEEYSDLKKFEVTITPV